MKRFRTGMLATFVFLCTSIMAQGPQQGQGRQMRSASERANLETGRLAETLGLSEAQKTTILAINLKYAAKDSVRFANRDFGGDRETMMKQMQEQRAAQSEEIKAALTDEQKAKYETYLKERQMRRPGGQGQGGPGQGGPGQGGFGGNRP